LSQNDNNTKNEGAYFLINGEWIKIFKNFCNAKEYFSEFINLSEIDNSKLIIQDNSVLKLKNEQLYFLDKSYDNCNNCLFIKKEIPCTYLYRVLNIILLYSDYPRAVYSAYQVSDLSLSLVSNSFS
jgi:hypothetical protein